MIVAVLLIVLALVYYLVSTIVALRKITAGLDEVIAGVGEIVEKSAPVNDVVTHINGQLDAGVELLEGLLVKKAGLHRRHGPDRGPLPGRRGRRPAQLPREHGVDAAPDRRGLHARHAHARPARAARRRSPPPARRARCCGTSRAAAWRRGCSTPRSATSRPEQLPGSPVIGTDAPVQYEQRDDIGAPRKRLPARRS